MGEAAGEAASGEGGGDGSGESGGSGDGGGGSGGGGDEGGGEGDSTGGGGSDGGNGGGIVYVAQKQTSLHGTSPGLYSMEVAPRLPGGLDDWSKSEMTMPAHEKE